MVKYYTSRDNWLGVLTRFPFLDADILDLVSSERVRPVCQATILARDSSVCRQPGLPLFQGSRPLLAAAVLAIASGLLFIPLCAALIFNFVSGLCLYPLRAATILAMTCGSDRLFAHDTKSFGAAAFLARVSGESFLPRNLARVSDVCFLPFWVALFLAICSGVGFRPLLAILILALVAALTSLPTCQGWGLPLAATLIFARVSSVTSYPDSPPLVLFVSRAPIDLKWAIQRRSASCQSWPDGMVSSWLITGAKPQVTSDLTQFERWFRNLLQSPIWPTSRSISRRRVLPTYRTAWSRGSSSA